MDLNFNHCSKDLKDRIILAIKQILKAGKRVHSAFLNENYRVFKKQQDETVTEFDIWVDQTVKTAILKKFNDCWISEESEKTDGSTGYCWIIDPIDGTNNFSKRIPFYCISLALQFDHKTVAGFVFDPIKNMLYVTYNKQSIILSGRKKIAVKLSPAELNTVYMSSGFSKKYGEHWKEVLDEWMKLELLCKTTRRLGAAALEICYVGLGYLGLYFIMGFNSWDVEAAILFAENAGAEVLLSYEKNYLLVYNPGLKPELSGLIEAIKNHH